MQNMILQLFLMSFCAYLVNSQTCLSNNDCTKGFSCKKITDSPYSLCNYDLGQGVKPVQTLTKCISDLDCSGNLLCLPTVNSVHACQTPVYCKSANDCLTSQVCIVQTNGLRVCEYAIGGLLYPSNGGENSGCTRDSDCSNGLRCVSYYGELLCMRMIIGDGVQPTTACETSTDCLYGQVCTFRVDSGRNVCMQINGGVVGGNVASNPQQVLHSVGGNVGLMNSFVVPESYLTGSSQVGGNVADKSQQIGESIADQPQHVGGNIASQPQKIGGDIADQPQHVGGNVAGQPQHVGGNIGLMNSFVVPESYSTINSQVGGNIAGQPQQIGGNVADQSQHVGGNVALMNDKVIGGNVMLTNPSTIGGNVAQPETIIKSHVSNEKNDINGYATLEDLGSFQQSGYNPFHLESFKLNKDDSTQSIDVISVRPTIVTTTTKEASLPTMKPYVEGVTKIQVPTYAEAKAVPKSNLIDPAAMPCEFDYQCRMGESCSGVVQLVDRNVTVCQYDVTKKNRMCIFHADCVQGQICMKNSTGTFVCADSFEAATGNLRCQFDYECSGGEICVNTGNDTEKKFHCRQSDYVDPRKNQKCASNVDCPYQQVCRIISGISMCIDIGSTVALSSGREIQEKVFKFVHDLLFARA